MKSIRFLILLLVAVLVIGNAIFHAELEARSRGFSGGSPSFGKTAPWSGPTHGTWDRHGGGIFGGKSSSGYSKPSLREVPGPASGYSKPTLPGAPGSGSSPVPEKSSSSGYSKPSLDGGKAPDLMAPPASKLPESSGYAKPKLPEGAPPVQAKPYSKTSGGYTKPTVPSAQQEKFVGGSKFDKQSIDQARRQRAQESLQRYKSEQAKFKNPEYRPDQNYDTHPLYQKGKVYSNFDYGTYYGRQDNFFRTQNYQPPAYAFNTSPSFGLFNTLFLFWMLDHITNKNVAAMAYHHKDDPGFSKWREEVEKQAKDNADLKAKLAEMDNQIKKLEGTPKDPGYLPPGVPPEVALAPTVLATKKPEKPVLRFATGRSGGWYDKYGQMLKNQAQNIDVQLKNTTGSIENLNLLANGEADIAIIQSDVLAFMEPGKKLISEQATLYVEYAQLLANRKSDIKSIRDLSPKKNFVFIGPKGSGTALTWQGLAEKNEFYKKIPVKYAEYSEALSEVERNPNALMFFVGGLNSEFLKKAEKDAEKSGNLRLIQIDDKRFFNKLDSHGNTIYKFAEIPSNIYPNLQKGWLFSGSVETLGVQAVLVLRTDWAQKFGPEAMDALSVAVEQTKPEIQRLANGT